MSMELMTRNHKRQNSSLFVWMLFVNMPQFSGPNTIQYNVKCNASQLHVFRESSVTDTNNKSDA